MGTRPINTKTLAKLCCKDRKYIASPYEAEHELQQFFLQGLGTQAN